VSLIDESQAALEKLARESGLIGKREDSGGSKPQLKLPTDNRQYSAFARELAEIIAPTKLLFRRDLLPVTINNEKRRFDPMSGQKFRTWAEQFIDFYRERLVKDEPRRFPRTMNLDVALAVLESQAFLSQLPEIKRLNVIRQPAYRESGALDLLPLGFFEEQGIYTLDDGLIYDLEMTGEKGAQILRDYFSEYPLDARSLAVEIAAMFTLYCSCMLPKGERPPSFVFTANAPRAGKTMLAMWPALSVTGSAAIRTLPRYEEARKVLDVIALQAQSYAIFDNIRGKIQGEEIEAFLTGSEWEVRPLGQSVTYRLENISTVFFTGNQITNSQDMADRSLFVELLVREADSRDRKFSRVIDRAFVADRKRRSEVCSALWAMLRAWDADGRPRGASRAMAGFEKWSAVVPPVVIHAGFGDPLAKAHIKGSEDEVDDMRALILSLAPATSQQESRCEFDDLIQKLRELGLFENEELRAGRRDVDLFEADGSVTRSGRSFFGKLFVRWNQRRFADGDRILEFLVIGRGDSRRYHIAARSR
jgi:hypothetical protein